MSSTLELSNNMKFLIVDAGDSYRNTISVELHRLGFKNIFQSTDATHALLVLEENKIDFIICERELPDISGFDFLKEVRESYEYPGMPFLMTGKSATRNDLVAMAEYEVDGYVAKPFTLRILSEKISQCIQHYRNPENLEYLLDQAKFSLTQGKHSEAIKQFEKLLEKSPNSSRVRVGLARCYRALNDIQTAVTYCKEAVKKNPLFIQAFDQMGQLYMEQDKIDEALSYFKQAININPNNPIRYENISELLMEKKKYKQAQEILDSAKNSGISYHNIFEQYGKAYFYQGKHERAIYYLEKALEVDVKNKSILNMIAIAHKDLGNFTEALKYYNIGIKHSPLDTKLLFNKALCFYSLEKYDKVVKVCEAILKMDPSNLKAQTKLSECLEILNKKNLGS